MGDLVQAGRPFTGAWIETVRFVLLSFFDCVAPSPGRGLKLVATQATGGHGMSPLHRGVD